MDWFGPARPCENITVTNCRLSSASSAIKFCDGNIAGIRNVTIDNCVITGSNRGIAFMTFDGGAVENVVLSNLTIDTVRYDWFWWGDGEPFHFNIRKRSEVHANWPPEKDRPAGAIRNVKIQNVIARGYGSSVCNGHPDSWLDDVSFENVKLTVAHDPGAAYDKAVHGLVFKQARNLRLQGRRGRLGGAGLGEMGERPGLRGGPAVSPSTASRPSRRRARVGAGRPPESGRGCPRPRLPGGGRDGDVPSLHGRGDEGHPPRAERFPEGPPPLLLLGGALSPGPQAGLLNRPPRPSRDAPDHRRPRKNTTPPRR